MKDILDAQLIALPDPRLQERACAVISMKPGKAPLSFSEMQEFLKQKGVAKQYWPEYLEVVDEFSKNSQWKNSKVPLERKDSRELK